MNHRDISSKVEKQNKKSPISLTDFLSFGLAASLAARGPLTRGTLFFPSMVAFVLRMASGWFRR